jgi:UDP-N-acetylglucosamine 2-epimerase (non-hydrolysing)
MYTGTGGGAMKIAVVVGTRPEFIKTWSVIEEAKNRKEVQHLLIHTGQHYDYELSQVFFEDLSIEKPDYYLGVGSLPQVKQIAHIMTKVADVLGEEEPDILLVQGDTNSCMAAALSAVQSKVPVGHIEAGCRSFDKTMPEEINRIVIDAISNLLFAPSTMAHRNLMKEGHEPKRAIMAGNTAVEAINEGLRLLEGKGEYSGEIYSVATIHRAGNVDVKKKLTKILTGLSSLPLKCIFPIHPRTRKRIAEFELKSIIDNGYLSFLNLMKHAKLVLTDSGGVQEEASLLGKPTLTLRDNTEWPETIWSGTNRLVHADAKAIRKAAEDALSLDTLPATEIYLEGAGRRIINAILESHKKGELHYKPLEMTRLGYPILGLTDVEEGEVLLAFDESGSPTDFNRKRFLVQRYRQLTFEKEDRL